MSCSMKNNFHQCQMVAMGMDYHEGVGITKSIYNQAPQTDRVDDLVSVRSQKRDPTRRPKLAADI